MTNPTTSTNPTQFPEIVQQHPDEDYEEGEICPFYGHDCWGRLEYNQEPCTCHLGHPPCSHCTNAWLECGECGHIIEGH